MKKINQTEMQAIAGTMFIRLNRRDTPRECLEALREHVKNNTSDQTDGLDGIRGALTEWVTTHFDRIRAQHRGFPDCTVCIGARMIQCFAQNVTELERGGYLTTKENKTWAIR